MNPRKDSKPALARAMTLVAALLAGAGLAASPADSRAESSTGAKSASASVDFTIRIPVVLKLRSVRQPAALNVSAEDVQRGYVDVDGAIAVEVVSNARQGFGLRLQAVHPVASAVSFRSVATPLRAVGDADQLSVVRQAGDPTVTPLQAGARITLAPGTAAGTYPWPVAVSAHIS